jgi:hypothetical protein
VDHNAPCILLAPIWGMPSTGLVKEMVDVWAIIGDPHMHKTSSIRALTGVARIEQKWNIAYAHGNGLTYVHPPGLQEIRESAQALIQKVSVANVNYVIVALRYNQARGLPHATAYLTAFEGAGWNIAGHAVLRPGALLRGGGVPIPNAPNMPSNEIAAQLRQAWGIN